jgi:hypothetical protein
MSDKQIREEIIKSLRKSKSPLTWEEIADSLEIKADFWRVSANLNRLQLGGIISLIREPLKKDKYVLSR